MRGAGGLLRRAGAAASTALLPSVVEEELVFEEPALPTPWVYGKLQGSALP